VSTCLDRDDISGEEYLAALAVLDWLRNGGVQKGDFTDALLVSELDNAQMPLRLKVLALRRLSPNHGYLTSDRIHELLNGPHHQLRLEAVRTLAMQTGAERFSKLAAVADDENQGVLVRLEAVAGLAHAGHQYEELLARLAARDRGAVGQEARRALEMISPSESASRGLPSASDLDGWLELLDQEPGNAAAGRRVFFSQVGAKCALCHQSGGRGWAVGPDLTDIGQHRPRREIVRSILDPSAEIAPRYASWMLETLDGRVVAGMRVARAGDSGHEDYFDADGAIFTLESDEIVRRTQSAVSLMPVGLEKLLPLDAFRDLVAFLEQGAE
jgi:putative heme-binding domain-containing protein